MENMNKWIKDEYEDIKKEEEEFREQQGMKELLQLVKGDNKVKLKLEERPRRVTTKYGERDVWELEFPEDKSLMLHPLTSRSLVKFVAENDNNPRVVIIRSGELKDTRYEFKLWVEENFKDDKGAAASAASSIDYEVGIE